MRILLICNYRLGVGGISGQVELLQRHLREEGHVADIFNTKRAFIRRLVMPCKLHREAKHYDILHIHCCSNWGFMPAVVGITVGRLLGKRIVLTYHGGGGEGFFDKCSRLVRHYLMRTDSNIVLSGFLAKVFDQHHIPYTVIPNIIELDGIAYRQRTELQPKYICVRAHEELYNIPCILRAFNLVQERYPTASLTLLGTGTQHEQLKQLAGQLGLQNITFPGRVDNSKIYNYLNQSDIMLSSPKVDNMPVSLLEAMNAGLLVISSRVGGVPYMIKDNNTGLLFETDNYKELAEKMLWALDNQPIALAIAAQGHNAVKSYLWEHIKDKIHTAYGIPT